MWLSAWIVMAAAGFSADGDALPALHTYQGRLRTLLVEEAQCRDPRRRAELITALCRLHEQIVADPRYATSPTLQESRAQLWGRLRRIKSELVQAISKADRPPRRGASSGRAAASSAGTMLAILEGADPAAVVAAEMSACAMTLAAQAAGGPASAVLGYGGMAVPPDYGPALVALIERTINPAFWDVQGGPGSIVYYAPLHCLVVRATAEIHAEVGGLVGELRAAGR
jgi:hypothetical protein